MKNYLGQITNDVVTITAQNLYRKVQITVTEASTVNATIEGDAGKIGDKNVSPISLIPGSSFILDNSNTQMEFMEYINYCKITIPSGCNVQIVAF